MQNLIVDFSILKEHDLFGIFFDKSLNNKPPKSSKDCKNFQNNLLNGLIQLKKHLQQYSINNFKNNCVNCHIVKIGDKAFGNLYKILNTTMKSMFSTISQYEIFENAPSSISNPIYSFHFYRQKWVIYVIVDKKGNKIVPFFIDVRHCIWPSKNRSIEKLNECKLLDWSLTDDQKALL